MTLKTKYVATHANHNCIFFQYNHRVNTKMPTCAVVSTAQSDCQPRITALDCIIRVTDTSDIGC